MPPQGQFFNGSGAQGADFHGYGEPDNEALARRQPGPVFPSRQPGSPSRQTRARLVAPGGRHRRPMPASLPESAPALVLAVTDACDNGLAGATAEIATVLRVDNPALDVRTARIDHGGRGVEDGVLRRKAQHHRDVTELQVAVDYDGLAASQRETSRQVRLHHALADAALRREGDDHPAPCRGAATGSGV